MKLILQGTRKAPKKKFNVGDKVVHRRYIHDGRCDTACIETFLTVTKVMRTRMNAEEINTGNVYEVYMHEATLVG